MIRRFRQPFACVLLWVTIALCGFIFAVAPALANPKLLELEQKIADLTLLHQQLGDRMAQAQAMRNALGEQHDQIAAEIQVLTKSLKIKTIRQATEHPRMHYNIELQRLILAYMDALDDKVQSYQSGRERLGYLRQLAEDDIRMIATLNDLKIDALTTQISLVINRYLPEAHVIRIDPQQVALLSAQQVWKRVSDRR